MGNDLLTQALKTRAEVHGAVSPGSYFELYFRDTTQSLGCVSVRLWVCTCVRRISPLVSCMSPVSSLTAIPSGSSLLLK